MSNLLRQAVEIRRKKLINKLIVLNAFKNEEQLCKLTLSELEYEYKKTQRDSHPHSETGLIHWTSKKL